MHSAILSAPVTFQLYHGTLVRGEGKGDEVTARKLWPAVLLCNLFIRIKTMWDFIAILNAKTGENPVQTF